MSKLTALYYDMKGPENKTATLRSQASKKSWDITHMTGMSQMKSALAAAKSDAIRSEASAIVLPEKSRRSDKSGVQVIAPGQTFKMGRKRGNNQITTLQ